MRQVLAPSKVTTDFNVLLFDEDGNYLGAVGGPQPAERPSRRRSPALGGPGDVQMVISRSGTGPVGATQLRNVLSGRPLLHRSTPTRCHRRSSVTSLAARARPASRRTTRSSPYLPEPYTSPGGDLPVYFDSAGKRYSTPQIRRAPQVASADRGNTTFFVADDLRDPDTLPNFGGTSASAPHAAAIAALVLQKAGGADVAEPGRAAHAAPGGDVRPRPRPDVRQRLAPAG